MKNRYKQKLIFVIAILCLSLVSCKSKTEPINNIASWTPDDGWTINGIDIRDDYANFILLSLSNASGLSVEVLMHTAGNG